ncbi:PmoA family protein [Kineococcus terrestris]|uniref:DUF6807 domain-containing protein n=1 Tax=Kineococcus terrestris TaxID=2044856 RepID=UPI0034DADAEB
MSTTTAGTALVTVDRSVPGRLTVRAAGVDVATYVHAGDFAAVESRKPYLHPLRTLAGAVVTGFRPNDHRWHKGLQMTATDVSGQNLWGGGTYVHGRGYVPLDNVGSMRHEGFEALEVSGDEVVVAERLTWRSAADEEWAQERRRWRFHGVDTERGLWVLDFATEVRNARGEALELGSPTTNGRPDAGYTGLFWRGPRGWRGGAVTAPGVAGEAAMGTSGPWLAFSGEHDEVDGRGTLLFLAGSSSAPVPLRWFVRSEPFAAVAPSFAFSEVVRLEPGEVLSLRHRVVVGDGAWDREQVEARAAEFAL